MKQEEEVNKAKVKFTELKEELEPRPQLEGSVHQCDVRASIL